MEMFQDVLNEPEAQGDTGKMSESLFQSVTQRPGSITEGETTFQYLERSNKKEGIAIRRWMEEWFREFPYDKKSKLKKRLQLEDFAEFMGAYFELQVFAILRRLECSVEVEPIGAVDFCARNGKDIFHVEATVCGIGQGILHSNPNEQDALQKIKYGLKPHSDLRLSAEGHLRTTLSRQHVVEPFKNLLEKYTPDEVRHLHMNIGPEIAWQHLSAEVRKDEWILKGDLSPPTGADGLGVIWGPARGGTLDGSGPLEKALMRKVEDWKKKDLKDEAFLIAINVCHAEFSWNENDNIDIRRALFAHQGQEEQRGQFRDELKRVSGIIVFGGAVLGTEVVSRVQLFKNRNTTIPKCLHLLIEEKRLGDLLGIEY